MSYKIKYQAGTSYEALGWRIRAMNDFEYTLGRAHRAVGHGKEYCPIGDTGMQSSWLAGWHDKDVELGG